MTEFDRIVPVVLDRIEREEAELLSWGVVDAGISESELLRLIEEVFDEEGAHGIEGGPAQAMRELYSRRLIFDLPVGPTRRAFRSRSAEAVRLFFRLRQLFPGQDWRTAPRLVSDYRWLIRERRYPKRHIASAGALSQIGSGIALSMRHRDTLGALLQNAGGRPLELADFQVRATRSMLGDFLSGSTSGMIVCAGTGSGKTLAFYLPAIAAVADMIGDDYWTKAIAIYPRNELLKDQLSEVLSRTRAVRQSLRENGRRPILIGAYFGPTPLTGAEQHVKTKWLSVNDWHRAAGNPGGYQVGLEGYVCPYFRCPKCEGPLAWQQAEIGRGRQRLHCLHEGCAEVVGDDEVVLTRKAMQERPPDILFTTTETLNRRMSDSWSQHVFGIKARRPPRLMLLDEVHTYAGTSGAQTALLLRRWRAAVDGPVHFTGLSATLAGPGEFFSQLTGLGPTAVEVIAPEQEELVAEGLEYMLALRGDPGSGASLLSTSIQATMLARRVLDPKETSRSGGLYGRKVFVFTDDLDVSNRLYHNLLDAEAQDFRRRRIPRRDPLASLRRTGQQDDADRLLDGQTWRMPEEVGHPLTAGPLADLLRVARTTSQDVGVDADAEVIVATASLEVGFDDADVGAVIQHKAPIDPAQFLQRKGRGGRRREMRPWTIVVLSDYGRDRLAYQGYDLLFDPTLEARRLPVENRYVLRMQAVFSLMEWIAAELLAMRAPKGEVWNDLTRPSRNDYQRTRQSRSADLLREVLAGGNRLRRLENHLKKSLRLTEDVLQALLWDPPRSLMLSVIPTALRRLETQWGRAFPAPGQSAVEWHGASPLPEFIPPNLFTDLNLPEVRIGIPSAAEDEEQPPSMPITQALLTFAPGRVTRRFAPFRGDISHWKAPTSLTAERQTMEVDGFCSEYEVLGPVQFRFQGNMREATCYRPWKIDADVLQHGQGENVLPTSNASPVWRSQIYTRSAGQAGDVPAGLPWAGVVREVRFFLHGRGNVAEVRRFALGSEANVRFGGQPGGRELNAKVSFRKNGNQAALGFIQEVDGIRFRVRMPADIRLAPGDPNTEKIHSHRVAYFKHRVQNSETLPAHVNTFKRDWLARLYLSVLVERALRDETSLEEAHAAISDSGLAQPMFGALDVVVQSLDPTAGQEGDAGVVDFNDDDQGPAAAAGRPPRLVRAIHDLLGDPEVIAGIEDAARCLWEGPDEGWYALGRKRFLVTLGNALLEACLRLSPVAGDRDLIVDIDPGPAPPGVEAVPDGVEEIWITETSVGGVGAIEDIFRRYASDPRLFFRLVEAALSPSDFEIIDMELGRVLQLLETDEPLRSAVEDFRDATGADEILRATRGVQRRLADLGVVATHSVMTALNSRVLRPGSNSETDDLLRDLINLWRSKEQELGIEVDASVFAFTVARGNRFSSYFEGQAHADADDPNWRYQMLYGLLWPRGSVVRASSLQSYNPFDRQLPNADRHLVADVVLTGEGRVMFGAEGWRERLASLLSERGSAILEVAGHDPQTHASLKRELLGLATDPIEFGFLHVYPRVEGIERGVEGMRVRLYAPEAAQ